MSSVAKFVPLFDRVLVTRLAQMSKTAGGLLIPEAAQTKMNKGVVVAAGPGRRNEDGSLIPMEIKKGDTVLLPEYGGMKVKFESKDDHFIFSSHEILGIFKD